MPTRTTVIGLDGVVDSWPQNVRDQLNDSTRQRWAIAAAYSDVFSTRLTALQTDPVLFNQWADVISEYARIPRDRITPATIQADVARWAGQLGLTAEMERLRQDPGFENPSIIGSQILASSVIAPSRQASLEGVGQTALAGVQFASLVTGGVATHGPGGAGADPDAAAATDPTLTTRTATK